MSGIVGSNLNIKGAGLVAKLGTDGQVLTSSGAGLSVAFEDVAGGISWQAVETGSTMTAVAGEGYPIDTTSNACTITLPASATTGDQIIFTDYARNWGTNGIVIDSNGLNYQGDDDTFDVEYGTDGQSVEIVYSDATKGWIPTIDDAVADVPVLGNSEGIIGFGNVAGGSGQSVTNLVSSSGVIATDTSGVGTARWYLGACEYGGDKAIFSYGNTPSIVSMSNLVSNAGVVATDVTGVGTARKELAACSYSSDKGIFGYGTSGSYVSLTNLVSNAGVIATDTTGVGTARVSLAACEYGTDKGIFGYGYVPSAPSSLTNLVSNVGVVATDVTGVGTARSGVSGCGYGEDKGIFAYGTTGSITAVSNLVSNAGVVATDTSGVGTARELPGSCEYGYDKGIFGYGYTTTNVSMSNLVSSAGVVATDVTGVGTARYGLPGCSFN